MGLCVSVFRCLLLPLLRCLGFGAVGIVKGSLAAAFQACYYGAFVPARGIFACLTSLAMGGLGCCR